MKTSNYKFIRRVCYFAFFSVIAFLILSGCKKRTPEPSIVFESEFKATVPDVLNVYINMPEKWSKDSLYQRFKMLNLDNKGAIQENDLGYVYKTKTYSLLISPKTGSEMFIDSSLFMREEPGKFPPMDEKVVIDLAARYISENIGIKPEEIQYLKTQHLHNAVQENGGKPIETVDESIVVYKRKINRTDIVGQGGFVKIHFDNQGKVTGFQKEWRNWSLYKQDLKVIPYSVAREKFMQKIKTRLKNGGTVKITQISFGYFERGFLQEQAYLQPAYVFKTVYIDPETKKSSAARFEVIPATEQTFEPLITDTDLSSRDDKKPQLP